MVWGEVWVSGFLETPHRCQCAAGAEGYALCVYLGERIIMEKAAVREA